MGSAAFGYRAVCAVQSYRQEHGVPCHLLSAWSDGSTHFHGVFLVRCERADFFVGFLDLCCHIKPLWLADSPY